MVGLAGAGYLWFYQGWLGGGLGGWVDLWWVLVTFHSAFLQRKLKGN